jgi:hypothetical protein
MNPYSQLDKELFVEKIHQGIEKARVAGKRLGRKPRKVLTGEELVALRELRGSGVSIRQCSLKFGITLWMAWKLTGGASKSSFNVKEVSFESSAVEMQKPRRDMIIEIWRTGDLALECQCRALEQALSTYQRRKEQEQGFRYFGITEEEWQTALKEKKVVCQVCRVPFRCRKESILVIFKGLPGISVQKTYLPCCSLICKDVVMGLVRRLKKEDETSWNQIRRAKGLLKEVRTVLANQKASQSHKEELKREPTLQSVCSD